ncbi:MAG: DUF2007 domain-containing protein [Bacteroidales bacterium]|nr:DUF2007 domain-containing protein [Bacteroidales bacterium]
MMNNTNENLELVYATGTEYLAELLKQILEENNITALVINRQDSSYHFGDIEVYVNAEDLFRAKEICEEFENNTQIE